MSKKSHISKTHQTNQRTINRAPCKWIFSTWDPCVSFVFTVNHLRTPMQVQWVCRTVGIFFPEGKPAWLERNFVQITGKLGSVKSKLSSAERGRLVSARIKSWAWQKKPENNMQGLSLETCFLNWYFKEVFFICVPLLRISLPALSASLLTNSSWAGAALRVELLTLFYRGI